MGSASSTHDDIVATLKDAGLDPAQVRTLIEATFAEDLRWGPDVTTEAIFGDERATAQVVSRAHGTLAGVPVGAYALQLMAPYSSAHHLAGQSYSPAHRLTSQGSHETQVHVQMRMTDGERVHPGDVVLTVEGPVRTLLTAERTMLNLVSQLSGVATATAAWVDALAGSPTKVRDTRKTVPGLRVLQKYAVRCGGASIIVWDWVTPRSSRTITSPRRDRWQRHWLPCIAMPPRWAVRWSVTGSIR